jgi:hypothetical protein
MTLGTKLVRCEFHLNGRHRDVERQGNRRDPEQARVPIARRTVGLCEGVLYVLVLKPSLHYELERVAKTQVLRKPKQCFGGKTIRDLRLRLG